MQELMAISNGDKYKYFFDGESGKIILGISVSIYPPAQKTTVPLSGMDECERITRRSLPVGMFSVVGYASADSAEVMEEPRACPWGSISARVREVEKYEWIGENDCGGPVHGGGSGVVAGDSVAKYEVAHEYPSTRSNFLCEPRIHADVRGWEGSLKPNV
jgi:hypothetical protein